MSVFTVDLANQPGELARLCEAMAGRGINLVLSAIAREDGGTWRLSPMMKSAPRRCDGASLQYAMRPALTIRMENQPGTGAATFRKLASAGVNADLLLPVRVSDALFFAVICVDDQDKARQALGAQVIPPGPPPIALAAVSGPGRARPGRSPPMPRSQRHRSYPGPDDETGCRPGPPSFASRPGDGSPNSSHRQSQSARRIRSSPRRIADYVRPGLPRRGGLAERRLSVIAPFRAQLIWVRRVRPVHHRLHVTDVTPAGWVKLGGAPPADVVCP